MVGDEQSTLERLDSSDKNASVELSIVIVNWRSKELLRDCLLSLSAVRAARPTEIIIIDGGSFDGCGEMLSADFPFVLFIQWPENVGFGRANNIACRHARGEFLWLLNPDTEVEG
jgi:N-acetylglucosaminyl-diphospho-decaprenol L-rhamnosyltransferase